MSQIIQSRTRVQIRESIGYNLADMTLVESTSTIDTASLIASYGLAKGGDDEYNGRQVYLVTKVGSIALAEKSFISDFAASTFDATCTPVFTASITDGDIFEMWRVFLVEEINDAINQAIMDVTDDCIQIKEINNVWTESGKYEYDALSSFVGLNKVEYVRSTGIDHTIDKAEVAWTSGTGTTTTADTGFKKEGNASSKNVVVSVGTNTILCYEDISSIDISDADKVEFWMYSSIALTAGQLQIKLSASAAIAADTEAIDIPAMDAATWYRHSLSLANPQDDTAIISVGIYQVANVADFTFYVDDVRAVNNATKEWLTINPDMWRIAKNSTNYLHLDRSALSLTRNPTQLRLTGYQIPSLMTADSDSCEIDPAFIIAKVTGRLLISHAKSSRLDISDRQGLSKYWLDEAEKRLPSIRTTPSLNIKWI